MTVEDLFCGSART